MGGVSSVSASLNRMYAFTWLSGTWWATCRTVHPSGRYGVSSCSAVRALDGGAQLPRGLLDLVDHLPALLFRQLGLLVELADGIPQVCHGPSPLNRAESSSATRSRSSPVARSNVDSSTLSSVSRRRMDRLQDLRREIRPQPRFVRLAAVQEQPELVGLHGGEKGHGDVRNARRLEAEIVSRGEEGEFQAGEPPRRADPLKGPEHPVAARALAAAEEERVAVPHDVHVDRRCHLRRLAHRHERLRSSEARLLLVEEDDPHPVLQRLPPQPLRQPGGGDHPRAVVHHPPAEGAVLELHRVEMNPHHDFAPTRAEAHHHVAAAVERLHLEGNPARLQDLLDRRQPGGVGVPLKLREILERPGVEG